MAVNSGTQALSTTAVNLGNGPCRRRPGSQQRRGHRDPGRWGRGSELHCRSRRLDGRIEVGNRNMVYVKSASGTPTCSWLTD
jgi:hypothetical protein